MEFFEKVLNVQKELKAPKGQYNSFGKYKYRSCEDIVEAVKPILAKYGLVLNLTDDIVLVGDRIYVKATARILDTESDRCVVSNAFAREPLDKKGMDESQITGTASSYARKYALNGLFAIDDTKDADTDAYTNITQLNQDLVKELESLGGSVEVVATYFQKSVNEVTNDDIQKLVDRKKKNAKV